MSDEYGARICRLLVTLIEAVRDLDKRRPKKPRALSEEDRTVLSALLPVVAAMFKDSEFTAGELMRRRKSRKVIDGADLNALELGHLLSRAEHSRAPIAGLYVHYIRDSRESAVYCVDANSAELRAASQFAASMRENLKL